MTSSYSLLELAISIRLRRQLLGMLSDGDGTDCVYKFKYRNWKLDCVYSSSSMVGYLCPLNNLSPQYIYNFFFVTFCYLGCFCFTSFSFISQNTWIKKTFFCLLENYEAIIIIL